MLFAIEVASSSRSENKTSVFDLRLRWEFPGFFVVPHRPCRPDGPCEHTGCRNEPGRLRTLIRGEKILRCARSASTVGAEMQFRSLSVLVVRRPARSLERIDVLVLSTADAICSAPVC